MGIKKIFQVCLVINLCVLFTPCLAQAQEGIKFLEKRGSYDVYLNHGDENTAIIKNVTIVRFDKMQSRTFLVIKRQGFQIGDKEGFILFDAVTSILPSNEFQVQYNPKVKRRH